MKNKLTKLIIMATVLFCDYNFVAFSQATVTFETITEALNYNGNKGTVKKLIITGTIAGNDYSGSSEWSKFRSLNETFPNIEEVEVLTDQDIPVSYLKTIGKEYHTYGLFYYNLLYFDDQACYPVKTVISNWLKSFSAPNMKTVSMKAFMFLEGLNTIYFPIVETIGKEAFINCKNLINAHFPFAASIDYNAFSGCHSLNNIYFPLVETIENTAFMECYNLASVDFPLATTIKDGAFWYCKNLVSVNFGTDFEKETEINFGRNVFLSVETKNIDLTLGNYVLPEPDLDAKIWQSNNLTNSKADYIWKSITIKTNSIEEFIKNSTVSIFPNPTTENATVSFELKKFCNIKILLCDVLGRELVDVYDGFANEGLFTKTIPIEHLSQGIYFLKMLIDGNLTVEKIILE